MHIKLTDGQHEPYSIGQLRRDNPQVSFPEAIPADTLAETVMRLLLLPRETSAVIKGNG